MNLGALRSLRKIREKPLRGKKHLNVLYLTASPIANDPLRVDAEVAIVQNEVQRSRFRNRISIFHKPAADLRSLLDGLNDHKPAIVHFSGHGEETGIAMDNKSVCSPSSQDVPFSLLSQALAATDIRPKIVVLNSCYSSGAKKALLKEVDVLIVMKTSISDLAAANFAAQFYAAVASGQSIQASFSQARIAVAAVSLNETRTPELVAAKGVDPAKIVLT